MEPEFLVDRKVIPTHDEPGIPDRICARDTLLERDSPPFGTMAA
jgi:hypothetical protein